MDDLVIVEASNYPPTSWSLGRITTLHPGPDQVVWVTTIRTQDEIFKRRVIKLVKLLIDN